MRTNRRFWSVLGLVVLGIVIILLLWKGPDLLLNGAVRNHHDQISSKDYATLLDDYRKTLAQVVGGIGLVFTLVFTWMTYLLSAREKITDRFAKAIELLGSLDKNGNPAWEPRMGGAYALGDIAKESPGDHEVVVEILTAYLRHFAHLPVSDLRKPPGQPRVWDRKEIQAILTVLGRRDTTREKNKPRINCTHLDLRAADLHSAHLENLNLTRSNLANANLYMAKLDYSLLGNCILTGTNFKGTDFGSASLDGADLAGADLHSANMSKCQVTQEQLNSANGNKSVNVPPGLNIPNAWK
jgi:hypothetical protein